MAEDFRLLLGAKFDSASIKRELDAIPQSARTVQVEVKGNNTFLKSTVEEGNKLTTTLTKINNKTGETSQIFERTKVSAEKMNTSLAQSSKHTKTLGEDFVSTLGKVAKFGLVTSILGAVTTAMAESVKVVKEYDSTLTEFTKVSDYSGDRLADYTDKLSELGDTVARTRTEMLSASTEFLKAGYSEADSARLAQTASLFQNIADSQLSASDSSAIIIASLKAFNFTAEQSTKIIDVINEVDKLAFPFGNIWVIKDNYIGQTLGIEETEERRFDKIKIRVDNFFKCVL